MVRYTIKRVVVVVDGNVVFVLADLVTHFAVMVEALEIIRLAKAVQVGGVARDIRRRRDTVELSCEDNRAGARTGRDAVKVKDRDGALGKSHHHGEEEEDGGIVHDGGVCARDV